MSHIKNVMMGITDFFLVQFSGHRHLPLHIHHPLSKRLPSESRGKKSGRKKKSGRRRGSASSGGAPTIEEDEQEEEVEEDHCSPQDGEGNITSPTPDNDTDVHTEPVQVSAHTQVHTLTGCPPILTICDSVLVFPPQFFVCDEDSNGTTVVKNHQDTPARQLSIVPESALQKSNTSPEDVTTIE